MVVKYVKLLATILTLYLADKVSKHRRGPLQDSGRKGHNHDPGVRKKLGLKALQSGRGHQDDGQKFVQNLAIVLAIDGHF